MTNTNKTEKKPTAIFTKWDYATGEPLDQRQIFMDPISFIEALRELWPGEHAIRYNRDWKGYEGAFGLPEEGSKAPFLYRFELELL